MSNLGATVLLVPLAVNIALNVGADPAVYALTVAIATSNSFLIPTHQVNALIMGPGGYRVPDFMRAGGIMTILFLIVSVAALNLLLRRASTFSRLHRFSCANSSASQSAGVMFSLFRVMSRRRGRSSTTVDLRQSSRVGDNSSRWSHVPPRIAKPRRRLQPRSRKCVCRNRHKTPVGAGHRCQRSSQKPSARL